MTDERRAKLAEDITEKARALAAILPEGLCLRVERGRVTSRVTLRESEPEIRVMPARAASVLCGIESTEA